MKDYNVEVTGLFTFVIHAKNEAQAETIALTIVQAEHPVITVVDCTAVDTESFSIDDIEGLG